MDSPPHVESAKIEKFKKWLVINGAELLPLESADQVVRFRFSRRIGVAYRNHKQPWRLSGINKAMKEAWLAFLDGKGLPWKSPKKKRKRGIRDREDVIQILLERDGDRCFYCGGLLAPENEPSAFGWSMTIEHLVARAHGGPDHVSNMVLAHDCCNRESGHMSVAEKVRMREQKMKEVAAARRSNASQSAHYHVPANGVVIAA